MWCCRLMEVSYSKVAADGALGQGSSGRRRTLPDHWSIMPSGLRDVARESNQGRTTRSGRLKVIRNSLLQCPNREAQSRPQDPVRYLGGHPDMLLSCSHNLLQVPIPGPSGIRLTACGALAYMLRYSYRKRTVCEGSFVWWKRTIIWGAQPPNRQTRSWRPATHMRSNERRQTLSAHAQVATRQATISHLFAQ